MPPKKAKQQENIHFQPLAQDQKKPCASRQTDSIRAAIKRKLGSAEAKVLELKGKAEGDGYGLQVLAAGSPADYSAMQFVKSLPDPARLLD